MLNSLCNNVQGTCSYRSVLTAYRSGVTAKITWAPAGLLLASKLPLDSKKENKFYENRKGGHAPPFPKISSISRMENMNGVQRSDSCNRRSSRCTSKIEYHQVKATSLKYSFSGNSRKRKHLITSSEEPDIKGKLI